MTAIIRVKNADLTAVFHPSSLTIIPIDVKHGMKNVVKTANVNI